jgi:hypothetical protein
VVGGYTIAAGSAIEAANGLTTILGTAERGMNMARPLWRLLLDGPSDLTCDECFALMEYYAELLTRGRVDLLPRIIEHLKRCPYCEVEYREAVRCLTATDDQDAQRES